MQPPKYKRVRKPENLKDIPRYLKELLGGFFHRFFYIVKLVWETGKWILFLLAFMALFKGVTPVIGSLVSRNILNTLQKIVTKGILPESAFWGSEIFYILLFYFIYLILLQVVNNLNTALNRIAGEKVVKTVKLRIMKKSKEIDLASFDSPAFFEKMENANQEAGFRPLHILTETFGIISTFIQLVTYLAILLSAPKLSHLTLLIVLVSIPSAIINFVYRRKNFEFMRHRSKDRRQMDYFSRVLVDKDLIKEVRMLGLADTFIHRYSAVFSRYFKGLRNLIIAERVWQVVLDIIAHGLNFVFYCLIVIRVLKGEMMLGDYTLYTGAILSVSTCVGALIATSATIYEGTLFIDNLMDFMKEKSTIVPLHTAPPQVECGKGHTIEFQNVSFRYPGTSRYVLKNINLTLRPGETLVLVGLNGAGKTTFLKLLTRLYDPTEGVILLDGRDIREYDVKSLYQIFGIVFQDFGKYAVTVEDNICFGDICREKDPDRAKFAAKNSAAEEFIEHLPEKYQTPLMRIFERDGIELSIGQWQKLAVSRAFYADSDILILDEPTASLDPLAEQEIFRQFDSLRESKTTIFVSHRLSSATTADTIVVLENGAIVETGNHKTLMAKKDKYYTLFTTQAERYLEKA